MPHSPRHGSGYSYSDSAAAPPSHFHRSHSAEPNIDPFDDDDAADAADADDADDADALDAEELEDPRIALLRRAAAAIHAHDPSQDLDYIPTPLSKPMGKLKTNRLRDRWQSRRTFVHPEDVTAQDLEGITAAMVRTRRPEPDLPTDHNVWVTDNHVTGTELSLRLALYLLDQNLVTADIQVALTGYELTRRSAPRFPVASFLRERGYAAGPQAAADWRTSYRKPHATKPNSIKPDGRFALNLTDAPDTPDLIATLRSGGTLRAHVSRGLLVSTRSPAEHKLLRGAIGRAITCESAERGDVLAAVVPRSKRFRELAVRWRQTECALRARLLILAVDRAGTVDGFPRDA